MLSSTPEGKRPLPVPVPVMRVLILGALLGAQLGSDLTAQSSEWHQWRGAHRDGRSAETGLLGSWPDGGPRKVLEVGGLGKGYSSLAASGDLLVTMGASRDGEKVIALDARSGVILWRTANGRMFRNDRGDGPRGTPTIDGDRVFALGANGSLVSLDLTSGEVVWRVDLLDRFGGRNIQWGLSESPLVVDGKVLVTPGGPRGAVAALDRETGETVWASERDEAGYSSPMLAQVDGQRQVVYFTGRRALGVTLDRGELLWSYDAVANNTANIATPIVRGDRVFLSSDYGTGCALLEIGPDVAGGAREVYRNNAMRNHHSSSVLLGDTLYGFSSSILTAMDFANGEVLWRDRSVGKGSIIEGDGRVYLLSERGVVGLAEVDREGYRETGRFELPDVVGPTWSLPILHRGRLYLRDQDRLYAYDVSRPE